MIYNIHLIFPMTSPSVAIVVSLLAISANCIGVQAAERNFFIAPSPRISILKGESLPTSIHVSQLVGYGDSPKCAQAKLALAKEISGKNLWFVLNQDKETSKYNPYPGSYFFVVRMLPSRGDWNYPFSSEQTHKVYDFMRIRVSSLSNLIIKSCPNISSVHFPVPHTGTPNAFYRHGVDIVKPFACIGQVAPSGWGFGPCT